MPNNWINVVLNYSMIQEPDVRALIRLLGEVSVLEITLAEKKRHLLGNVCRLIDGDGWAWTLTDRSDSQENAVYLDQVSGGDAQVLKYPTPGTDLMQGRLKLSVCQISGSTVSVIMFVRRADREPFTAREEKMCRIVCEEIPWLHERQIPVQLPEPKMKLPPRQAATLALLVKGVSRKMISQRLRISPHTVDGYIKNIYRHFGIHSRTGLINRLATRSR